MPPSADACQPPAANSGGTTNTTGPRGSMERNDPGNWPPTANGSPKLELLPTGLMAEMPGMPTATMRPLSVGSAPQSVAIPPIAVAPSRAAALTMFARCIDPSSLPRIYPRSCAVVAAYLCGDVRMCGWWGANQYTGACPFVGQPFLAAAAFQAASRRCLIAQLRTGRCLRP